VIVRVVPRVDRGERLNAGIVVHSRPHRFLGAQVGLDEVVLHALAPECDADEVRAHLEALVTIADGRPDGGPIAHLTKAERFHWLVSPSSTVVQVSEVHTGLTDDPAAELSRLFRALVSERR
jgi:hypothetical protein